MFRFIFRLARLALVLVFGAAVVAKLTLRSNASEQTQEIDLVNVFGGETLVSNADPFFGGKITNVFAGTHIDLRKVTPAPTGIYLDVLVVFGGLNLVVPHGWKVVFDGTALAGGYDDLTVEPTDPDAPIVRLGGLVAVGGIRATTRSPVEAVG